MRQNMEIFPGDEPQQDVEGHIRTSTVLEGDEGDVEGHIRTSMVLEGDEEDVEGHMQPPRDLDIERF
ncbi:hypothetical protein GCM10009623_33730 [Nocardioides aestuarii]|uniref:DUF2382 domain-containing protein n=1 Tax=Nocardioides aestuarii TaxID=252231 RepID=A0ABW4TPM1_9ACTN